MLRFRPALAVLVALILVRPAASQQQAPDPDELLSLWQDAVQRHVAGTMDAPMRWLDTLPVDLWKPLNVGLKKYLSDLAHDKAISNTMLEHAVVLHMDVAIFGGPAPAGPRSVGWLATPPPALVKSLDGELIGSTEANWHWIFARALIDLMYPSPRNDPFAPAWYHAAAAFMLQHGLDGELGPHFDRAAILFPRDANLIFDRACLAEAMGMPRSQLVNDDLREKQAAARRPSFVPGQLTVAAPITLPTADQSNAQAERFFRQTLDIDPTFAEARVRLSRLLENRGKAAEALVELGTAARDIDQHDHVLLFYSHLIAARAHQALSELPEAMTDVRAALALDPNAQSALIVQSELALRSADAEGALAPLRRLTALAARGPDGDDPWWLYDIGAGRIVDRLVPQLWMRVNASRH
jgi:tetratricopeptide (TPR) repeat protein